MTVSHEVSTLPTFAALDGHAVLDGTRRGASIQLDGTYFDGQLRALETFEGSLAAHSTADRERRAVALRTARDRYGRISVDVDSLTEPDLRAASDRFRRRLQRLQEVEYLERGFPGCSFVVPEWLQTGDRLHYGARVYFFRSGDAPAPEDVVQENIAAVVDGSFEAFERYQGRLHGYPDCCIDFYHERSPDAPAPEWRSVEPFAERIDDDVLGDGASASIDEVLPRFSDWEDGYAFFAREFFPEPGCETALSAGRTVHERLSSSVPDQLVDDYFALTFGHDYLVARAVRTGGSHRPAPGTLGREHLLCYLPLRDVLTLARYS